MDNRNLVAYMSMRGPVATVRLKGSAEVCECWLPEIVEVRG